MKMPSAPPRSRFAAPVIIVGCLGAVVTLGVAGRTQADAERQQVMPLQQTAQRISDRGAQALASLDGSLTGMAATPRSMNLPALARYAHRALGPGVSIVTHPRRDPALRMAMARARHSSHSQYMMHESGLLSVTPVGNRNIVTRISLARLMQKASAGEQAATVQLLEPGSQTVLWSAGPAVTTQPAALVAMAVPGMPQLHVRVAGTAHPGSLRPGLVLASGLLLTLVVCLVLWRWLDTNRLVRATRDLEDATDRLRFLTERDSLTGLVHREALVRWLEEWDLRHPDRPLGVVYVDLDSFNQVNATYGHVSGDDVLRKIGRRLSVLSEDTDSIVARVAGDHFVVMRALDRGALPGLAYTVRTLVTEPIPVGDREIHVEAAIGVALRPEDGRTIDTLMRNADFAARAAKLQDGDRIARFHPAMAAEGAALQRLTHALRSAVHRPDENFHLVFQPQVDMNSGVLIAAEALLRWRCDGEEVSPTQFIPLASDNGLVPALGRWVLREACRTVATWRTTGVPAAIAVNVDARQLVDGFAEQVAATMEHTGIQPDWLLVEVTEAAAMGEGAQVQLERVRALGVGISIDDFGTGFSSLSRLTELPAQQLKIDRAFVAGLDRAPGALEIVRSVVALADALGMQVLAEGVESAEQAHVLMAEGIRAAQGYVYSKPVDADSCLRLWRTGVPIPSVTRSPSHSG